MIKLTQQAAQEIRNALKQSDNHIARIYLIKSG